MGRPGGRRHRRGDRRVGAPPGRAHPGSRSRRPRSRGLAARSAASGSHDTEPPLGRLTTVATLAGIAPTLLGVGVLAAITTVVLAVFGVPQRWAPATAIL